MLKKTIVVLLVALLLNPGYVAAQPNTAAKSSLENVKTQALNARNTLLTEMAPYFDASTINSSLQTGAPLLAILGMFGIPTKSYNELFLELEKLKFDYGVLQGISRRESRALQFVEEFQKEMFVLTEHPKSIKALNWTKNMTIPDNAAAKYIEEQIAKATNGEAVMFFEDYIQKEGFTESESKALADWLNHLNRASWNNFHELPSYVKTMLSITKKASQYGLKDSMVPAIFSRALLKRTGFLGVALLLVAGTASAANSDDAKISQRIMQDPDLFLKASEAELAEIEQNYPMAEELCRAYAEGLIQLAEMSDEDKKAVVETAIKLDPQYRAQVDVTRSLRSVKAR